MGTGKLYAYLNASFQHVHHAAINPAVEQLNVLVSAGVEPWRNLAKTTQGGS